VYARPGAREAAWSGTFSVGRWGARNVGLPAPDVRAGGPAMRARFHGEDIMRAALELFEQLEIEYIPSNEARRRGPRSTCCGHFVQRLIRKYGQAHMTIVLRSIVESSKANETELIADTIGAISDVVRAHPRWVGLGMQWLEAFDLIGLAQVRVTAKAANVQPLRVGIATLICLELAKTLGPSRLPKPPKPPRIKREPKPPRAVTRVAGVEANVELGRKLVALRSRIKSNRAYGRAVRAQFDVDTMLGVECARVARAYGERPEVYRRLSWEGLIQLSSPTLPSSLRQDLERRILAGERISGPDIIRARNGRPRRAQHHQTSMAA
jgi:hypothetical protein